MKKLGLLLGLLTVLSSTTVVLAVTYTAIVTVANNSTVTYTPFAPTITSNTTHLVDNSFINTTANDTAVLDGGIVLPHMVASDRLMTFLDTLVAGTSTLLDYTWGNDEEETFEIIPGHDGSVTLPDSDNTDPGDNFSASITGYAVTANGTDKNYMHKTGVFRLYNSPTVSGVVIAELTDNTSANATPSSGQVSGNTTLNQFSAINLVDGSTASSAFYTDVAGPGAAVMLDFQGTPTELISWRYYTDSGVHAIWDIEYSADNVTYQKAFVGLDVAGLGYHTATWESVGHWRYWRSLKTDPAIAGAWHRSLQTLSHTSVNATAPAVADGLHTFLVEAVSGANLTLIVDGVTVNSTALGALVPVNIAGNWTLMQNNVMPYAANFSLSVNGTQQVLYAPNDVITTNASGTWATLPDRASDGTSNSGNITWGVNPANINTSIEGATFTSTIPTAVSTDPASIMPTTNGTSDISLPDTGTEGTNFPFYELFEDWITALGVFDMGYFWAVVGSIIVLISGMIALFTSKSMLVAWGVTCVLIGLGATPQMGVWSMNVLYVYAPIGMTVVILQKVVSI